MKRLLTNIALLAGVLIALAGCSQEGDLGLEGALLFQDKPLVGAQVEIYLKAEKNRSVQPFAVTTTDQGGHYKVVLPEGRYFVIGKKRDSTDEGRSRMLMAESPANPLTVDDGVLQVASFNLREMGREGLMTGDVSTGVTGKVTFEGHPVSRAYVYIYTESDGTLIGPSYGEALQTDKEGHFNISLPAGRYSLVARKRVDGGRSGVLSPGDLNASYPGNPIDVTNGEVLLLDHFPVARVSAEVHAQRQAEGVFAKTDTVLKGHVVDQEGLPVDEVFVFAYLDSRMVGKPVHMSAPSDVEGKFELFLNSGGTYYVGARSSYGGPLEPGEWIGTYEGQPDHGIEIAGGTKINLGDIIVREFW